MLLNTLNDPSHSDWPLESAFIQSDDDDGGGTVKDDGEIRSRDELLHQILRDQVHSTSDMVIMRDYTGPS